MAGTIKHEWVGTTLVITSDSGSSGCDLKGDRGDIGIRGPQGPQGEKPEVFFTVGIEDDTVLDTEWRELNVNGTRVVESINLHTSDMNNPHGITCEQIGADVVGSAAAVQGQLLAHIEDANNPHKVDKVAVGLDQVDNTSDIDKPVSTAQRAAINEVKEFIDANTEAINSMNNLSTGILAQAKEYVDEQLSGFEPGSGGGGGDYYTKTEIDTNFVPATGGTFTGAVVLGLNSYVSNCSNYAERLRNSSLSSTAASPSANGAIVWQYG